MVDIAFEPPLRAERWCAPTIAGDRTIKVVFQATLARLEWRRLQQQGGVVELWSNLPIQGTEGGNWNAVSFEEGDNAAGRVAGYSKNVQLSAVIYLQYLILPSNSSRYSYTYRIKFSGGRVQWLGTHSSNGSVIMKSEAYWTPGVDDESSTLGSFCRDTKWRAWGMTPSEPTRLLSLEGNETAPPVQTLLLVPDASYALSQGSPILFSSNKKGITLSKGQVQCATPKNVKVHCGTEVPSILQILHDSSIQVVPTAVEDCFLVSSFSPTSNRASIPLTPIWLSSHIPAKIKVKASNIQDIMLQSEEYVLYLPGEGGSQSILPTEGEYEIPLAAGFESLCVVRMQMFPSSPDQSIGVATSASVSRPHQSPISSISSPTSSNTSITSTDSYPHGANLKFYKSSGVLFDRTIPLPLILIRQVDRLMRIRLLGGFYRLALYMLSLVMPFFGVTFSLKWAINNAGKQELLQTRPQETVEVQESATDTSGKTVRFEAEPIDGEIKVAFRGDAVDDVAFTFDGRNVDTVITTWQGDDLHQFTLQVENQKGILTALIGPHTDE